MTIDGITKTITRDQINELLEAIGIEVRLLRSLLIERTTVMAELLALKEGKPFVRNGEVATHHVTIKITD